ncbi:MAG: MFS transporter, partial [Acinetobacter sp.]
MTSDTIVTGDNKTDVSSTDTIKQAPKRLWMTAFIFAFLILLCDGADIGILA